MSFKINPEMELSKLKKFELDVIHFLKGYEEEGTISLDYISSDLSNRGSARSFRKTFDSWKINIKKNSSTTMYLKTSSTRKENTYLKMFAVVAIVVAAIVFFFTYFGSPPCSWPGPDIFYNSRSSGHIIIYPASENRWTMDHLW